MRAGEVVEGSLENGSDITDADATTSSILPKLKGLPNSFIISLHSQVSWCPS